MGNVIASGGAKLTPAAWDKPQDTRGRTLKSMC